MVGLVILFVLVVLSIALYLFYIAGLFTDIETWVKTQWAKIKLPEKPLFDRNIITKKKETKVEEPTPTRITASSVAAKIKGGRSSADGEDITDWERKYLWEGISKRKRVPCFHCLNDDMYSGAQGGMSQNWHCPNCGQGINLAIVKASEDGLICQNIGIDKDYIRK